MYNNGQLEITKLVYLLFILPFFMIDAVMAQKKCIDSNAYLNWSSLGQVSINNNGKYVQYIIKNEPKGGQTLVFQSTKNNWKRSFTDFTGNGTFSVCNGGEYAAFVNQKDSLVIVYLGDNLVEYIPNVSSFKICHGVANEWLVYYVNGPNKNLIIENLNTKKKYSFVGVSRYMFNGQGQYMVLLNETAIGDELSQTISWLDLNTGNNSLIWKGRGAGNLVLDEKSNQFAFTSEGIIYHYNRNFHKLESLIDFQVAKLDSGLKLGRILRFSNDGQRLFIDLQEETKLKPISSAVEIWSYVDHKLQSQQEQELVPRTYVAVLEIFSRRVVRLEQKWENLTYNTAEEEADTVGVIVRQESDGRSGEDHWNIACKKAIYLISIKNGKKIIMDYYPTISPGGKFAVYFDAKQNCYISYNVETGIFCDITKKIAKSLRSGNWKREYGEAIAGWSSDDKTVFLYDKYDLWSLDLLGQRPPINLTNDFGETKKIIFSIVYECHNSQVIRQTDNLILSAFEPQTKRNGFYKIGLKKVNNPILLSMGSYIYDTNSGSAPHWSGFPPQKSKYAETYIVRRMSASEAPNYYSTTNFKTFLKLSDLEPEKKYNWYTTELHSWKSLDGRMLQGILYKPENFDQNKKYPVIFHYYERKSDGLNVYLQPSILCDGCNIDIPTYVSNGYLVFTPDIYYEIGDPMQGSYDAVMSAAEYIGNLPFVNKKRMGLQGCSFGGMQTNYLITHSNLFAAACSASGIADWVSNYGRLGSSGDSKQGMTETGQFRMGGSLWEKLGDYIKTSPIFYLNRVTTPFLIMHTKNDGVCAYQDALELFTGLRRLGKRAWMLAYPDENHGIYDKKRSNDFSTRMMQFFEHYLRDKPAPLWMLEGIPASRRGLDDCLALDTAGRTPGPGLLIPEEQKKVDSLFDLKPVFIEMK